MVSERLISDVGPTDAEWVVVGSIKNIAITYRDSTNTPINPAELSLEITDLGGNLVLEDIYLPIGSRSPLPPRIINPSAGRFEFPFGLDNGSTDGTKRNRTDNRCDFLFNWRARLVAQVKASLTVAPAGANNDLIWTAATPGTPGNSITIQYVDPGAPSAVLSVVRTGATIVVNLATNGASVITTTAAQIIAAVVALTDVTYIVTVANAPANDGSGVVTAMASAPLAGGIDGSEELHDCLTVKVISHRQCMLIPRFRLLIDKAVKLVHTSDPDNPCFLGYTEGQLIKYMEWGLQIINAYQPSGVFTVDTYPYDQFEFTLMEAALMAGVMSQDLFAVDTDIPSWNDQGNAFVIQHQPQLASYLNWLSARLDRMIPIMKLNFVNSGSIHIEAGPNYRLTQLLAAAPSGALFRNLFFKP